jgi:hypothetical protein
MLGNPWIAAQLAASQERLSSMKLLVVFVAWIKIISSLLAYTSIRQEGWKYIIIIISCCFHFWSIGHPWNFVSLQFLNVGQSVGPLHEWSTHRKASITQDNTRKTHKHINIHASSRIRTYDHGIRASEDSSCLRSLGYRDQHEKINIP